MSAFAHGLHAEASVLVEGSSVTARIVDAQGAPVEGLILTVSTGLFGKAPGKEVPMTEGPAGTYKGHITVPQEESYKVTVSTTVFGSLLRASINVNQKQPPSEVRVPMEEIYEAPPEETSIVPYVVAAGIVLVSTVAIVISLLKRSPRRSTK